MAEDHGETALARLRTLIDDYEGGRIDEATLGARVAADAGLRDLARQRAGDSLAVGDKVIDFGANNQLGDLAIHGVAGRDIINLTITMPPREARPAPQGLDDEEMAHRRTLIAQHRKMLNALELQAAKFGIYAPPHIMIEIEDLRGKIAGLKREIGER